MDYWLDITWRAPSCCQLETGVVPVGRPREEGVIRIGTQIVTPNTETKATYFYASSRNYRLDDPAADEETTRWQQIGFHDQDKPMIEPVQTRMGSSDLLAHKPILLATDAAAIRVRRMLKAMITEEDAQDHQLQIAPGKVYPSAVTPYMTKRRLGRDVGTPCPIVTTSSIS